MADTFERAEAGDLEAQVELARAYEYGTNEVSGISIPKDKTLSLHWYLRAANQGHAAAQYRVAEAYEYGFGLTHNDAESSKWLERAAAQGDFYAQLELCRRFRLGEKCPRDDNEAFRWCQESIRNESRVGWLVFCTMGEMYAHGRGTRSDHVEAAKWFELAAKSGDEIGMLYWADALENGRGTRKNTEEARKWFLRAGEEAFHHSLAEEIIERGEELPQILEGLDTEAGRFANYRMRAKSESVPRDANLNLAFIYERGELVEREAGKAIYYFLRCAECYNNIPLAFLKLGQLYSDNDPLDSTYWYYRAAEAEYPEAQHAIGKAHEEGLVLPQAIAEAEYWYEKAAAHGHEIAKRRLSKLPTDGGNRQAQLKRAAGKLRRQAGKGSAPAMASLGLMYFLGVGVAKNDTRSYEWFSLAAALGDTASGLWRDRAQERISDTEKAKAQDRTLEYFENRVELWAEKRTDMLFEDVEESELQDYENEYLEELDESLRIDPPESWPPVRQEIPEKILNLLSKAITDAVNDLTDDIRKVGLRLEHPFRCRCGFFAPITCGVLNIILSEDRPPHGPFRFIKGRAAILLSESPEIWHDYRCRHPLWDTPDRFHMWCSAIGPNNENLILDFSLTDLYRCVPNGSWARPGRPPSRLFAPATKLPIGHRYYPNDEGSYRHFQDVDDELMGSAIGQGTLFALSVLEDSQLDVESLKRAFLAT